MTRTCPTCRQQITIALVDGKPAETVPVGGRLLMLRLDASRGPISVGRISGELAGAALHAVHRAHDCVDGS